MIISLISCKKEPIKIPENHSYLHISHTRTASNPKIDSIAEIIDYNKYSMVWLGGDLAYLTSSDEETISYVNSIFDIESESTLWSLGNHDYSDLELIQDFTNRPPYYAYHQNNITFLVLDTQDSLSNIIGNQLSLVNKVIDTINESTHLILLHHKLIWMYNNPLLEPQVSEVSNGMAGDCFYCLNPNNFYSEIYPRLIEVKNKGIEVICIAGDIGFNTNEFQHITQEGIYFLASGIEYGSPENKALLFYHDMQINTLSWQYKLLTDL